MNRKQIDQVRFARLIRGKVESARLRKDEVRPASKAERKTRDRKLEKLLSVAVRTLGSKRTDVSTEELEDIGRKLPPASDEIDEHLETSRLLVQELSVELIKRLKRHPEDLKLLDGHVFEDLVAQILLKMGFEDVFLRVRTELGEVDILGFSRDLLSTKIGYVFELKQLGVSGSPVELNAVTRLYGLRQGLRERLGISQGVFVTTTDYTRPAAEAGSIYGLSLKAHADLKSWLEKYDVGSNGLFLCPG